MLHNDPINNVKRTSYPPTGWPQTTTLSKRERLIDREDRIRAQLPVTYDDATFIRFSAIDRTIKVNMAIWQMLLAGERESGRLQAQVQAAGALRSNWPLANKCAPNESRNTRAFPWGLS